VQTKVNGYNLVILQGQIKSVERKSNNGKALSRLLTVSNGYTASVYCYALLSGNTLLKEGGWITVIGKLRYSTQSKGYKIIATNIHRAHEGANFNLITVEGYLKGNDFKHYSANKIGDVYTLPLKIEFNEGKKNKADDMVDEAFPYILEGSMRYSPEHKLIIKGEHLRCTYPVIMEV